MQDSHHVFVHHYYVWKPGKGRHVDFNLRCKFQWYTFNQVTKYVHTFVYIIGGDRISLTLIV